MSYTFSNSHDTTQKDFTDAADSTMRWFLATGIIVSVISTVAIVAIVYAIVDCLKRAGTAIPAYAKLSSTDTNNDSKQTINSMSDSVAIPIPSNFSVQPDLDHVEFPTMENFLSNMAKEKPVRFSPNQLETFTDNYSTILGSGGFGVVFKGIFPNGVHIAVKVLTNNWDKRVEEQFMAEVGALGRTYHINLVKLYGFCFHSTVKALLYEYMENGSLDKLLFTQKREIEWEKLHDIAVQTAKGLSYLHEECERKIIHYDIKPGNVLLDKNLNPKVADFGLAKLCNREITQTTLADGRGTPGYAAPEMWMPYPVTHKCDVYSFGMLLFEVIGRRRNYDDSVSELQIWLPRWTWDMYENGETAEMLSRCEIEEKDREKAERMIVIALQCIQHSPEARPQMSSVVQMLEGYQEITQPTCPFEHLKSHGINSSKHSGTDDSSFSSSTSSTTSSQQAPHNKPCGTCEIELASC